MRKLATALALAALFALPAHAQLASDEHVVTFEVETFTQLLLGPDVTLVIDQDAIESAVPGQSIAVQDVSSFDIVNNQEGLSVQAELSAAMPEGLELHVTLSAVDNGDGGTSAGQVLLTDNPAPVLNALGVASGSGTITYELRTAATSGGAIAPVAQDTRDVIYTIVADTP